MKKILLDTNFLMICYQSKVDIFSEIERICSFRYKIYVLDKSIDELKSIIERQKGKNKEAAKIALQLLKIKDVNIIKTNSKKQTDDIINDLASEEGYIVATQDKDLKRKLVNQGATVIALRQKKLLIMVNDKGFY